MQLLFALDYTEDEWREVAVRFWNSFPAKPGVKAYAEELAVGIFDNVYDLDEEIIGALDHWQPDRVGRIERCLLRIALYEIRHAKDVPPVVAINEAIDLAKEYIGEDAPRFINGVLDRLKKKGPPVKVEETETPVVPDESDGADQADQSDEPEKAEEPDQQEIVEELEENNEHS
jgi:N utilization substance protein B